MDESEDLSSLDDILKALDADNQPAEQASEPVVVDPSPSLVPSDVRQFAAEKFEAPLEPVVIAADDSEKIDVKKYIDKAESVFDEILDSMRADRQEAQDLLLVLKTQITDKVNNNHPFERLAEAYATTLEAKTGITANAVKMVDSMAKILAATKAAGGNTNIHNNNLTVGGAGGGTSQELTALLAQPLSDITDP